MMHRADEIMDPDAERAADGRNRTSGWSERGVLIRNRSAKDSMTPVFFGSALTNFGVETFLEHFLKMTTSPLPRACRLTDRD